jgi:hypothetical protein
MLHFIFAFIVLVHGFLHLLGFAHELTFTLDDEEGMTAGNVGGQVPERMTSVMWLISYCLFLVAAVLFIVYTSWWWMPAALGVLLSQILILSDWNEAKYGTITNVLIVLVIITFLYQ